MAKSRPILQSGGSIEVTETFDIMRPTVMSV